LGIADVQVTVVAMALPAQAVRSSIITKGWIITKSHMFFLHGWCQATGLKWRLFRLLKFRR